MSVHCGGGPSSASKVVNCHSLEELAFQILDRWDLTLLQRGAVWSTGPLGTLGNQAFWCCLQSSRL
jgi:hypothetical protein